MIVTCEGLDLADGVLKVSKALNIKTTNPVLEGIKIVAKDNEISLFATDLELSIEKKIRAEVKREGEIVVPGKFFSDFIKKLTNEKITLELLENNTLKISYLDSEGCISCYDLNEYPKVNDINTKKYFSIQKKRLKNLINRCIFSVAVDDTHPILKGCLFEIDNNAANCISSDGYRISKITEKIEFSNINQNCIVAEKSLREISKLLDDSEDLVNVCIDSSFIMIDLLDTKIITRTLEGEFLNYKQIISSTSKETIVKINKKQLEESLERASTLSRVGQNNLVTFLASDEKLKITSHNEIGNIKENVVINLKGNDIEISFNARYFLEALRVNENEFIEISFYNSSYPCTITPVEGEEENFLYLILPVRLVN